MIQTTVSKAPGTVPPLAPSGQESTNGPAAFRLVAGAPSSRPALAGNCIAIPAANVTRKGRIFIVQDIERTVGMVFYTKSC